MTFTGRLRFAMRYGLDWARHNVVLPLVAAPLVFGLGQIASAAEGCDCPSTYDRIVETGVFKAGVRFDYPPLGYLDVNGKPAGFGPDIAREFARRLGVKVELVGNTSRTRIPMLLNGSFDAEIGPTSPTVKRDEVVDFSINYLWDVGTILVRKGESLKPKDYGPPKKVAATQGSFFIDLYKQYVPNAEFTIFQEYPDAATALLSGSVDAVLINRFNAISFTTNHEELAVGKPFVQLPLAITVRQNDSKWRDWINWTLQRMWLDGTYQALFRKHFGEEPDFYMWAPSQLQPGLSMEK